MRLPCRRSNRNPILCHATPAHQASSRTGVRFRPCQARMGDSVYVPNCEGFRTPARSRALQHHDDLSTGVRKPPGSETPGDGAPLSAGAMAFLACSAGTTVADPKHLGAQDRHHQRPARLGIRYDPPSPRAHDRPSKRRTARWLSSTTAVRTASICTSARSSRLVAKHEKVYGAPDPGTGSLNLNCEATTREAIQERSR